MSRYSNADAAQPSTWANHGRGARARVRALKRFEAEERNAAWSSLGYEAQIEQLHRRRGLTMRQRDRLAGGRKQAALDARRGGDPAQRLLTDVFTSPPTEGTPS